MESAPAVSSTESSFTPVAFVAACASFVTIGAASTLLGPILDAITTRFNVSLPTAGITLSLYFAGAFAGVLVSWTLVHHRSGRRALQTGFLILALGGVGVTLSALDHTWPLFLLSVMVTGMGFGDLDFALNAILSRTAFEGRAHRLSFANAFWGVGSVLGPLLIWLVHPRNFPLVFSLIAVMGIVCAPLMGGVQAPALRQQVAPVNKAEHRRRRRPVLVTFIAAFVLYVATEATVTGWIAASLHGTGYSQSTGSLATAGFWITMTFGRAIGGWIHRHLSITQVLLGGLASAIALSALALVHVLAPAAYVLMGFFLAGIYVFGLLWYQSIVLEDDGGVAIILVWTMVGGAIGPALTSWAVSLSSVRVVPVMIGLMASANLGVFLSARRFTPFALAA